MPSVYAQDQKALDPSKFSFSHYWSAESMQKDLRAMFPPGTPIKEVEKILVEKEGATFSQPQITEEYRKITKIPGEVFLKRTYYKHSLLRFFKKSFNFSPDREDGWAVSTSYNKNLQLIAITVYE